MNDFKKYLKKEEESVFDYLDRGAVYYRSLMTGAKLDDGVSLRDVLGEREKEKLIDEISRSILSAVKIQCNMESSKLNAKCERDDFYANGYCVCFEFIKKFDPEIGSFYGFMKPYIKRALSKTIEQGCDIKRNNQMLIKKVNNVINDLSIKNEMPIELIRKEDIMFELKSMGQPEPENKVVYAMMMLKEYKNVEEYEEMIKYGSNYVPSLYKEATTIDFDFNAVLYEETYHIIMEFLNGFNEVDKFLCYRDYYNRYSKSKLKELCEDSLFVDICNHNKVSCKHVKKGVVEIRHIDNRRRFIREKLMCFMDYLKEIDYLEEVRHIWDEVITNLAEEYFNEMENKYNHIH